MERYAMRHLSGGDGLLTSRWTLFRIFGLLDQVLSCLRDIPQAYGSV